MGLLRCVVQLTKATGGEMLNIYHFNVPEIEDLIDAGASLIEDARDRIQQIHLLLTGTLSEEVTAVDIRFYQVLGDGPNEETLIPLGSLPWIFAGSQLADPSAPAQTLRVNATPLGRSRASAQSIGGWTEQSNIDGTPSANAITDLIQFGLQWVAAFVGAQTGASFIPVLWSILENAIFDLPDDVTVFDRWGSQRTRVTGSGL